MPELPDVEGFRRELARDALGRLIQRVEVTDSGVLRNVGAAMLHRALRGEHIARPERHGKWLLARTTGPTVMLHFGMTGSLCWWPNEGERHRHDRVIFVLDKGELRYRDMRKLRGLWLARGVEDEQRIMGRQGPDATQVNAAELRQRLGARGRMLKPALMDQRLIAGLGNLLADEMLWHARLLPERDTTSLAEQDWQRLHRAMRKILRESIPEGCVPDKEHWLTGHRHDRLCPRCRTELRRKPIGGRTSYWCPRCQS
ncbi:MAG TPA: DNA-formamidopyrimidine glycosylase family protein [Chloroflexota bacterium]